jgi:hypothetical protein
MAQTEHYVPFWVLLIYLMGFFLPKNTFFKLVYKLVCKNGLGCKNRMNARGGLKMACYVQFSSFHQKTLKNINDFDPSLKKQQ